MTATTSSVSPTSGFPRIRVARLRTISLSSTVQARPDVSVKIPVNVTLEVGGDWMTSLEIKRVPGLNVPLTMISSTAKSRSVACSLPSFSIIVDVSALSASLSGPPRIHDDKRRRLRRQVYSADYPGDRYISG